MSAFQSYFSPIQTFSGRLCLCNLPNFNPILVRFKPGARSDGVWQAGEFQSYFSPIQTYGRQTTA